MSATGGSTRRPDGFELHEIRVQGHLDERWSDWMEGLVFTHESDGTTTLTGPLADQSALHGEGRDRKSTRLNSSHVAISYAVFCLKKKKKKTHQSHRQSNHKLKLNHP